MNLIPLPYRILALALLLAAGIGFGYVQGCRHTAAARDLREATADAAHAREVARLEARNRETERGWAAAASLLEQNGYAALQEKQHEIDRLRAAADSGAVRLRVAATCPGRGEVPGAAASAGLGDGAGPELDAAARPAYFALRSGIDTVTQQLTTCQALLRNDRSPGR